MARAISSLPVPLSPEKKDRRILWPYAVDHGQQSLHRSAFSDNAGVALQYFLKEIRFYAQSLELARRLQSAGAEHGDCAESIALRIEVGESFRIATNDNRAFQFSRNMQRNPETPCLRIEACAFPNDRPDHRLQDD